MDSENIRQSHLDEQDQASLWIIPALDGDPQQMVDNLTLDELTGWFGYYGHIDWDDLFDWWQG